jgi:hypothetical protein
MSNFIIWWCWHWCVSNSYECTGWYSEAVLWAWSIFRKKLLLSSGICASQGREMTQNQTSSHLNSNISKSYFPTPWGILCANLTGVGVPRMPAKHSVWECLWGCFQKILAFESIDREKKVPDQCGLASCTILRIWIEQKVGGRESSLSSQARISTFSCPETSHHSFFELHHKLPCPL